MTDLSALLQKEIDAHLATGAYDSREDLLLEALRALDDQTKVEELLLEALNSGDPIEITPGYWDEKKRLLVERMRKSG